MRRSLRYTDAVKMLGGGDSKLIAFLDTASSGVLLGVDMIDVFEAKNEAVRLAEKTLKGLKARLNGLNALTRSERLAAAHWIIVITAFFEAVDEQLKTVGIKSLGASAAEQVTVVTETLPGDEALLGVARSLAGRGAVPDVEALYQERAEHFIKYFRGLAVYGSLSADQVTAVVKWPFTLRIEALERYQERLRDLAEECVEFNIWLNLTAHSRTLEAVGEVHNGLARLESFLTSSPWVEPPYDVRGSLSLAYRSVLHKPITQQASSDLDVPTLGEGYIDHRFRVANWHPTANPAQDAWWQGSELRDDLDLYLASYLVSAPAHAAPLLVLGHPGSGKSVLTRVLAARLPADRFLPVRVELRSVDANADLQTQIEEAVRQATGETVRWPELVRSAPEALPVVLLDGFDELLQATGVAQTDFLERVARFQEREIDQGRAVAVVVTSRIAVADRARIPADTVVMCLEPFNNQQIKTWLEVWAAHNEEILARRGLRPLSADVALSHRELAAQPLMLLMLALYDASANALRGADEDFGEAALYEALLSDFARREIQKERPGPAPDEVVELELARLSVVAFAMFNRGAQWATDEDVTADLTGLRMAAAGGGGERRMQKNLTAGQLAVGRFFFVHDTQAMRDGSVSQTYEFLHATFGEFLIARFVSKLIAELADSRRRASTLLPTTLDDGWLHALLSFECLAARSPIVKFLMSMVPRDRGQTDLLLELFASSLDERSDTLYAGYRPVAITIVRRHASWSANLMLLAAISGDGVMASQLFAGSELAASDWRDTALLWRGQLTSEGRNGLIGHLEIDRTGVSPNRDLFIKVSMWAGSRTPRLDWTYALHPTATAIYSGYSVEWMNLKNNFTAAKAGDVLVHGLEPVTALIPDLAHKVVQIPGRPALTVTNALLAAVASFADPDKAGQALSDLVAVTALIGRREAPPDDRFAFRMMSFGVLHAAIASGVELPLELHRLIHTLAANTLVDGDERGMGQTWMRSRELLYRLVSDRLDVTAPVPPTSAASLALLPSPEASSPETPATPPAVP